MAGSGMLEIRLLGGLELRRDGATVVLPKSRKTKALLAYLALNEGPLRREWLYDIFWDLQDDPRGALRWSLSKLRAVVNDGVATRLVSDDAEVAFVRDACRIDWLVLNDAAMDGFKDVTEDERAAWAQGLDDGLLARLDLTDCHDYQAWLTALRGEAEALREALDQAAPPDGADEPVASDAPPVPEEPAIAVLPFVNMSGDTEQEYFSDGITEDIITALAAWRSFPVIARNSTFTYKGQAVDVRKVGAELGARYVLEGSVRKAGQRVRITAQLIDAGNGHHLWAEKYDRELVDIFDLQDEMTHRIASTVAPQLGRAEQKRAADKPAERLGAWDSYQRGVALANTYDRQAYVEAKAMFAAAIERDPSYSQAYSGMADMHYREYFRRYSESPEDSLALAMEAAQRAVALDDDDSTAHNMLGLILLYLYQHDPAIAAQERAVALNPSNALAYIGLGSALAWAGHAAEGVPWVERGLQLNPRDPTDRAYMYMARVQLIARNYEAALHWAERSVRQRPIMPARQVYLIASLGHMGRTEEGAAALAECEARFPHFVDNISSRSPFREDDDRRHFFDGLRKAGWTG